MFQGAFGKVLQAEALGLRQPGLVSVVAVKMLKEGHTDTEMIDLVSEMDMMKVGAVLCGTTAQPQSVSVTYHR